MLVAGAVLTSGVVFSILAAEDSQNAPKREAATEPTTNAKPDKKTPIAPDRFPTEILPLVQKYCVECHGAKKPKGDIALHGFKDTAAVIDGRETWEAVLEMVESSAMPPEKSAQPTAAERKKLIAWLESTLYELDCKMATDPGRVTIRRLNRAEYNNTVRDLLGVDFRPADDFPSDDVGHGFDNIGDVLSLPPLLMEKYITAGEEVAASAVATALAAIVPRERRSGTSLNGEGGARRQENDSHFVPLKSWVWANFDVTRPGEYIFRMQASVDEKTAETAKFELRSSGEKLDALEVKSHSRFGDRYEVRVKFDKGRYRLATMFLDATYKEGTEEEAKSKATALVSNIELEGPIDDPQLLAAQRKTRFSISSSFRRGSQRDAARETLGPIVRRAFRRPVDRDEIDRFAGLVELTVQQGDQYQRGLEVALTALLVSPHFLFRVERDPQAAATGHTLSDFELASRLSYFLWSTMPDDELFRLAEEKKLHEDEVLTQQVKRMLTDPKSKALAENFASQWLNLRMLDEINPDPQQFPTVSVFMRTSMRTESELFFDAVVREDRSILDFLDGDFTFVNYRLAQHYGMTGIDGNDFRRVPLTDGKRAGILTHAGILTLTSNPTRTSPVKRGKWIMENILGTPPPDPPANVPELSETQKASPNATLRQQLEIHRKSENCSVCHRTMDALGFGLENFDPVGRWRDRDGQNPIDPSGTLPDGETFKNPLELVKMLKGKKGEFGRFLTGKLLTYALGRGPIPADRCTVDKIVKVLDSHDYRFSVLVTEIVKSEPFRMRRGEPEGEKP